MNMKATNNIIAILFIMISGSLVIINRNRIDGSKDPSNTGAGGLTSRDFDSQDIPLRLAGILLLTELS